MSSRVHFSDSLGRAKVPGNGGGGEAAAQGLLHSPKIPLKSETKILHPLHVPVQPALAIRKTISSASKSNLVRSGSDASFDDKEHTDRFECSSCNKNFNRRSHLLSHERTHSGAKPFPCKVCGKRFTQSGSLNRHIRSHNPDWVECPYPCSHCCKRFASEKGLIVHMNDTHKQRLPIPTEKSGETERKQLKQKRRQVQKKAQIEAQSKLMALKNSNDININKLSQPIDIALPTSSSDSLRCATAAPATPPNRATQRHHNFTTSLEVLDHSGLPPRTPMSSLRRTIPSYECPVCFKSLPNTDMLDKHVRMHNTPPPDLDFNFFESRVSWLDELPLPTTSSPPISPMLDQGYTHTQKPLECMLCWQSFAHCNHLNEHLFSTHFKTPPSSPKLSVTSPAKSLQ